MEILPSSPATRTLGAAPLAGLDRLPTLSGGQVSLRWLEESDAASLLEVFGDPEVMRYWSCPPMTDVAATTGLIREIHRLFESRSLFQWGVVRVTDQRVIGTCTLSDLVLEHRRAQVGFILGRAHWGQGLMSDAVTVLVRFAFELLGLHRLEADVDPRNERSLRLLARQGFQVEGRLRETYFVGPEVQDSVILGLLRRDWRPGPSETLPG